MQLIIICKPHNCQHHYHSIKNHLWEILVCEGEKEQGRNRRKMNCFPKYMQWLHYKICAPICMKVSSSWPPCKILDGDRCIETFRPPPNHPPLPPPHPSLPPLPPEVWVEVAGTFPHSEQPKHMSNPSQRTPQSFHTSNSRCFVTSQILGGNISFTIRKVESTKK